MSSLIEINTNKVNNIFKTCKIIQTKIENKYFVSYLNQIYLENFEKDNINLEENLEILKVCNSLYKKNQVIISKYLNFMINDLNTKSYRFIKNYYLDLKYFDELVMLLLKNFESYINNNLLNKFLELFSQNFSFKELLLNIINNRNIEQKINSKNIELSRIDELFKNKKGNNLDVFVF